MTIDEIMKEATLSDLVALKSESKERFEKADRAFWDYSLYRNPEDLDKNKQLEMRDKMIKLNALGNAVSRELDERINFILERFIPHEQH